MVIWEVMHARPSVGLVTFDSEPVLLALLRHHLVAVRLPHEPVSRHGRVSTMLRRGRGDLSEAVLTIHGCNQRSLPTHLV